MILYFMLSVSKDLGLCFSLCEKIQPRETFEIVIASPSSEIPFSFFVAIQIQHQIAVPSLFYSYALLWKEITLGTALVEHDSIHLFTQTIHQLNFFLVPVPSLFVSELPPCWCSNANPIARGNTSSSYCLQVNTASFLISWSKQIILFASITIIFVLLYIN